jgi:hypothetical protein
MAQNKQGDGFTGVMTQNDIRKWIQINREMNKDIKKPLPKIMLSCK